MADENSVGLIGAGNMGGAIIRGLLSSGIRKPSSLVISDSRMDILEKYAEEFPGIRITGDNRKVAAASIVILALKPNIYEQVIQGIRSVIAPETLIVTIAAGIRLKSVEDWFQGHRKIVSNHAEYAGSRVRRDNSPLPVGRCRKIANWPEYGAFLRPLAEPLPYRKK